MPEVGDALAAGDPEQPEPELGGARMREGRRPRRAVEERTKIAVAPEVDRQRRVVRQRVVAGGRVHQTDRGRGDQERDGQASDEEHEPRGPLPRDAWPARAPATSYGGDDYGHGRYRAEPGTEWRAEGCGTTPIAEESDRGGRN